MQLYCKKCNTQVTKDIVKMKYADSEKYYNVEIIDEEYDIRKYYFKDGIYKIKDNVKSYISGTSVLYMMNPSMLLAKINKEIGCCSYSHSDIVCNGCNEVLGDANDDCWQDTVAYVIKSKVFTCDIK